MKSILALRTKSSIAIKNAENGQTIRTLTVDGEVVGSPSTSGDIGYVSVKKIILLKRMCMIYLKEQL